MVQRKHVINFVLIFTITLLSYGCGQNSSQEKDISNYNPFKSNQPTSLDGSQIIWASTETVSRPKPTIQANIVASDSIPPLIDIGSLEGIGYTSVYGINNFGQVAGDSTTSMGTHGFFWTLDGGMIDIGTLAWIPM